MRKQVCVKYSTKTVTPIGVKRMCASCLLLQEARGGRLLEGKTEYPDAIRSQFKHHLVSDTDVAARSLE